MPAAPPTEPDVNNLFIRFVSSRRLTWIISIHSARQWLTQGYLVSPWAHNYATLALYRTCVDTICGFNVPLVVPLNRTLCPASPSLQWVPWALVPHLHGTDAVCCFATGVNLYLRYYASLRLPIARLGFLHSSLVPRYLLYVRRQLALPSLP